MKRALVIVCLAIMSLSLANCGQTFELQSITVSPDQVNLDTVGAVQLFTATAFFSNTKTADLANRATFSLQKSAGGVDPAGILTLTNNNEVQVVSAFCTWTPVVGGFTTDPFILNVSFTNNGVTKTAQALISVSSDGCSHP